MPPEQCRSRVELLDPPVALEAGQRFVVRVRLTNQSGVAWVSAGTKPISVQLTNTTYTALSMLNGDSFSKKFGGSTGNDPDYLRLIIQGRDAGNAITA